MMFTSTSSKERYRPVGRFLIRLEKLALIDIFNLLRIAEFSTELFLCTAKFDANYA